MSDRCIYHEEHTKAIEANREGVKKNAEDIQNQSKLLNTLYKMGNDITRIATSMDTHSKKICEIVDTLKDHEGRLIIEENKEGQEALNKSKKLKLMLTGSLIGFAFTLLGLIVTALLAMD